jgi:hypothetical protein
MAEDAGAIARELKGAVNVAEDAAKEAKVLATDTKLIEHAPKIPKIPTASANEFKTSLKEANGVKNALADLKGAGSDLKSAGDANALKNADNAERNMTALDKAASRNTKLGNILQSVKNNPKKALAGIALVTIGGYAGARLDSTDGVDATITNIKIVDSSHIQVSYTPPNSLFAPAVNDQLTFTHTGTTPSLDGPTRQRITSVVDNSTLVVNIGVTSNGVAPFGTMTAHSSFENQVVGTTTEIVATAASAIAQAGEAVLNAAGGALCDTMPFLCNSTMWIIVGVICCLLIFGVGGFFLFKK